MATTAANVTIQAYSALLTLLDTLKRPADEDRPLAGVLVAALRAKVTFCIPGNQGVAATPRRVVRQLGTGVDRCGRCLHLQHQQRAVGPSQANGQTPVDCRRLDALVPHENAVDAFQVVETPTTFAEGYRQMPPTHVNIVDLHFAFITATDLERLDEAKFACVGADSQRGRAGWMVRQGREAHLPRCALYQTILHSSRYGD